MKTMLRTRTAALIGAALWIALPASAVPTIVVGADTPTCDVLPFSAEGTLVDELGEVPPFPVGEQIAASATTTTLTACASATDSGLTANALVSITNLNAIAFSAVWYVADYDTTITNIDGTVLLASAFQIDAVGSNQPLVSESGAADGIFASGETWVFIIQDYFHLGVGADDLDTIGLPSAGTLSSGSIIALPVPEPTTAALLGLGLLGLSLARGRRL
jgi:hypothetical protein